MYNNRFNKTDFKIVCLENRHYSSSRKIPGGQVLTGRRPWVNINPYQKEKGGHIYTRVIIRRILRTSPLLSVPWVWVQSLFRYFHLWVYIKISAELWMQNITMTKKPNHSINLIMYYPRLNLFNSSMQNFTKPNWNLCMEERLTIRKKLHDKHVMVMKNNSEIYGACWQKTSFHLFCLSFNHQKRLYLPSQSAPDPPGDPSSFHHPET